MASNALREGFMEVIRDPALLLIEIGWRWTFGAIAILVFTASAFFLLGSINFDPHRLESLTALNPWQLAHTLAGLLASVSVVLFRVAAVAGLLLAVCWTVLSAVGRYATLTRPALAPGASLRACLAISAARALVALAAILAWITAGLFAGMVGAVSTAKETFPIPLMSVAILLPALILIVGGWSTLNWYLSLAPLSPERGWRGSVTGGWKFARLSRDQLLEMSIITGILRAGLFVVALLLCLAVSAVITNPRVSIADLVAISLLYFLIADFIYVARLVAYAKLRMPSVTQRSVTADVNENIDDQSLTSAAEMPHTQAGAPVPRESFGNGE
jgi:hypothetical protein